MPSGVAVYEPVDGGRDFVFRELNRAGEEIDGVRREELIGQRLTERFPAVAEYGLLAVLRRVAETGEPEHHPVRLYQDRRREGYRENWVYRLPTGEVVAVYRDVTDRERALAALRDSEQKYRTVVDHAHEAIAVVCHQGIRFANPAAVELSGYSAEELTSRPLLDFIHPDDRPMVGERLARRLRGEEVPERYELRMTHASGRTIWAELSAALATWEQQPAVVAFLTDVTEHRALQEQVRHAQRLESVGRLAGGVAHDFNNLLSPILTLAKLVHEELPAESPFRADLEQISQAAERAARLTRQLLAFGRQQQLDEQPVELGALVRRFAAMVRRTLPEDVELGLELAGEPLWVSGDPSQLEQVLMNLVVNAADVTPSGGVVSIRCGPGSPPSVPPRPRSAPGQAAWVRLSVRDTGPGIPGSLQSRIFEPFFTTKPSSEGTGLGLATAYGIVKQHGGELAVESEVGEGAAFHVDLPAAERNDGVQARSVGPAADAAGDEHVLVVEDDRQVAEAARRCLARRGYRVTVAGSGSDALALARAPDHPIDLLLTDLVMPGMTGLELYERLVRIRPGVPVLYMSGHGDEVIAARGIADFGAAVLPKPFTPRSICRRVRAVLDAHKT